jgi:hypothetical protein
MIQFSEVLADAYVHPVRNIAMPSLPGRQVKFLGGHAVIKDGRDLVAMLRRADVRIDLRPYALGWADELLKTAGNVKADVHWPESRPPERPPEEPPEPPPEPSDSPASDPRWPRDPLTHRFLKRTPQGA